MWTGCVWEASEGMQHIKHTASVRITSKSNKLVLVIHDKSEPNCLPPTSRLRDIPVCYHHIPCCRSLKPYARLNCFLPNPLFNSEIWFNWNSNLFQLQHPRSGDGDTLHRHPHPKWRVPSELNIRNDTQWILHKVFYGVKYKLYSSYIIHILSFFYGTAMDVCTPLKFILSHNRMARMSCRVLTLEMVRQILNFILFDLASFPLSFAVLCVVYPFPVQPPICWI